MVGFYGYGTYEAGIRCLKEFPFHAVGCQQADAVTEVHDTFLILPDRPILVGSVVFVTCEVGDIRLLVGEYGDTYKKGHTGYDNVFSDVHNRLNKG